MIFAELRYDEHYSDMHVQILELILITYPKVEHGHQGDSWIWIFEGDAKVAIDTFSSMHHQIKASAEAAALAHSIIATLRVNGSGSTGIQITQSVKEQVLS